MKFARNGWPVLGEDGPEEMALKLGGGKGWERHSRRFHRLLGGVAVEL